MHGETAPGTSKISSKLRNFRVISGETKRKPTRVHTLILRCRGGLLIADDSDTYYVTIFMEVLVGGDVRWGFTDASWKQMFLTFLNTWLGVWLVLLSLCLKCFRGFEFGAIEGRCRYLQPIGEFWRENRLSVLFPTILGCSDGIFGTLEH